MHVYYAKAEDTYPEFPMAVLVNQYTASAGEILAACLQDHRRAVIVGTSSFGKGTVQTWHQLSNNGGVRITVARWLTPGQTWVHGTGIEPDYFIPLPEVENRDEFVDTQLQAAVDYLLGKKIISVPPENEG